MYATFSTVVGLFGNWLSLVFCVCNKKDFFFFFIWNQLMLKCLGMNWLLTWFGRWRTLHFEYFFFSTFSSDFRDACKWSIFYLILVQTPNTPPPQILESLSTIKINKTWFAWGNLQSTASNFFHMNAFDLSVFEGR